MEIKQTNNYNLFKIIDGNRIVNKIHVKRLKNSIIEKNLIFCQPILVNDKFQIIDGQHRFLALKELKEDIHYIQIPNLTIEDVKRLNINTSNWNYDDYMESNIKLGFGIYQNYKDFKNHFDLGHPFGLALFQGLGNETKTDFEKFKNGQLKAPNIKKSFELAKKYKDFSEYIEKWKRKDFYRCFWRMINTKGYDHQRMLRKLSINKKKIKEYNLSDVRSYCLMMEDLYNFKDRGNYLRFY